MRIKLTCLSCGHLFELGDAYESYTGEIRCWGCRATLEISLFEGKLQSMKLHDEHPGVRVLPASPPPSNPPNPGIEVLILPQTISAEILPEESRPRRKAR